ncbi:MAG: RecX family transcriptional regulator [Clostridia bacterium]|nr:RecX family transcriptional regulator [Clostridia bacterium]
MDKEEFDELKTKILKYVLYKKRTEKEIRQKFANINENDLDDAIYYLKEAGYIDDSNYIERAVQEFISINTLSIKEIKYKLMQKGIDKDLIEDYFSENQDELEEYEQSCAKKIYNKKISNMEEIEVLNFLRKKGYKEDSIKNIQNEE